MNDSIGDATFPFRTPVLCNSLVHPIIESVKIFHLYIYICADLLALAVLVGHPGQAGVTSQWDRLSAKEYKRVATVPMMKQCAKVSLCAHRNPRPLT